MKKFYSVKNVVDFGHFLVEVNGDDVRPAEIMDARWSRSGATCYSGYLEMGKTIIHAIRLDQLVLDDYDSSNPIKISSDKPIFVFNSPYHGADLIREENARRYLNLYVPEKLKQAVADARDARFHKDFEKTCRICKAVNEDDTSMFLYLRAMSRKKKDNISNTPPLYFSELLNAKVLQMDDEGNKYYKVPDLGWYHLKKDWGYHLNDDKVKELKLDGEREIIIDPDDEYVISAEYYASILL